ncbi:hypothetical protein QWZ10_24850 [Paracoccus cavernae]|uniref:Iron ABC transporter permease n=1 Tax=Paracoccus cavernae TaxID=1571207 RepID=A0ABT8DD55_9RHOB|nr:hypothetical protein [Paracoccus cavernae]
MPRGAAFLHSGDDVSERNFRGQRRLFKPFRSRGRVWLFASFVIAALVMVPVAALLWQALQGSAGLWSHLARFVLPHALSQTAILMAGVGVLVAAIGTGAAWLVTAYDFKGKRVLEWALLLPLAVPTYIVAYAYLDLLHPLGPVQSGCARFWVTTARASSACPTSAR